MKLTEKYLQGVKADKRRDLSVTGRAGLILRLTPDRGRTSRVFRYRYFRDGAARYVTLGDYPRLTLADAHELHARCVNVAKSGGDPQALVEAYWAERAPRARAAAESGPTVADVVKEFLAVAERQRKRPEQARYLLESNVIPSLGDRPVNELRKRDIIEVLDKIVRRGSPVLANRVQQVLKQAFQVAADRDLIESVPIFPRALAGGDEQVRTRVLSESEIRALWNGLDTLSAGAGVETKDGETVRVLRPIALALKLQLVTAQRRGEIASARWDDISDGAWCIPLSPKKKRAKEHVPHCVPLSPFAERLLDELRSLAEGSAYWLPSQRTGKLSRDRARSISKAAREARAALQMRDWRPHDLRRTARTFMAKIGVSDTVAERVLGHGPDDPMVATYNQHPYRAEMRAALDAWASELERILSANDGTKP
ncbi:MAG: tyrosine-type recombinase/integrase [Steroidobacteraceae bacterium]